jgi:hypothetical protein
MLFGKLTADSFAYILDCLANFAFGGAVSLLNVAASPVGLTFSFHLFVIYGSTDILFDSAFSLVEFAFNLIFVW